MGPCNIERPVHLGEPENRCLAAEQLHCERQEPGVITSTLIDPQYVFSGSAVIDSNNTSGFFPDQDNGVVAIYTLAEYPGGMAGVQYQAIAYSRDDGYTFEAYEGNPVLYINSTQFRDPYVIWHSPTERWVMVISYAAEYKIGVFTSPDLKDWTPASNFTKHGYLGVQYECPNLLQMPMKGGDPVWFLMISLNPGGPRGGSISQYFVGDFNGTHFEPFDDATRFTDFAKDNYAAQFFHGIPANEPQIALGWASNWQYTQLVPTGLLEHGQFRSTMTVPRENYIANVSARGYDLISGIHNVSAVIDKELAYNSSLGNGTLLTYFGNVESGAMYFEANITNLTSTLQGTANFTISSSISGEYISGGINAAGSPGIWIDRGHIRGFDNPYFTDKFSEEGFLAPNSTTWSLSLLYDNSILEMFLNGAQQAGTVTFFPDRKLDTLAIYVGGIPETAGSSVAVWSLKHTWAGQADGNGTVKGNVTEGAMGSMKMF